MSKRPALRLAIALPLLFVLAGWIAVSTLKTLSFTPDSRIWVTGTSTIHDWTCEVSSFDGTVQLPAEGDALRDLAGVRVEVPVRALDCKNGTMDKKAADALKAKAHPAIRFTFAGVRLGAPTADGGLGLKVDGALEIAGARRDVTLDATGYTGDDGTYRFKGSLPVTMTRFDVDPPTAMLGTLKTGDEVVVHFDVAAR